MTPQLQQAIRLLQLSTFELHEEIQEALESNPLLDLEEPTPDTEQEPRDGATEAPNGADIIDPPEGEWMDVRNALPITPNTPDMPDRDIPETATDNLHDYLLWQLRLTHVSDTDFAIANALIDAVDDDGYLIDSLESIHRTLVEDPDDDIEIELGEMEAVLHQLQALDPAGVCARDLRECLLIQLRNLNSGTPWCDEATTIVDRHLDLLARRELTKLKQKTRLSDEDLQEVVDLIRSLNPRPGGQIGNAETQYVIPDIYVTRQNDSWVVTLNPESSPKLKINPYYAGLAKDLSDRDQANYLRGQLQEARWLLKSLQTRNETLVKVGQCIVEHQQDFLEHGEESMKPLVLREVAEQVEMHESTISRVTTRKYMHTPRGIFEFKYFFSSHLGTTDGGERSSTAIRAMIQKIVAEEEPGKPLSDSKISKILLDKGINVARRTVAKYREAMSIQPSSERKRLS